MSLQPTTVEELQHIILENKNVVLRGGGTKPALSTAVDGTHTLDMSGLSGIIEYQPDEYTFTAYAGTPLKTIVAALKEHNQYLPFVPLLIEDGATLGGTVAANTSGSERWRYGGVRDFILGVRFVDGQGRYIRGGGKVVKNAAGFDLPKFFVGSIGHYGALVEISFKVFPQAPAYSTLHLTYATMPDVMDAIYALMTSPLETDAIDIEPHDEHVTLLIRISGLEAAVKRRLERLQSFLQQHSAPKTANVIADDTYIWQSIGKLEWLRQKSNVIKVPIAPRQVVDFKQQMQSIGADARYPAAGNTAWVALDDDTQFIQIMNKMNLVGLRLYGKAGQPYIGQVKGLAMLQRMKQVLDPHNVFGGVYATRD